MIGLFTVLLALLLSAGPAYADDILLNRLEGSLPPQARWALVAVDLQSGRELVNMGSGKNEPLVPGSLVKLFTTGALLDRGGSDLGTEILYDGAIDGGTLRGNLYLRGRGNPFLAGGDLKGAAEKLAREGIRRITGDVVADDSLLDPKGLQRSYSGSGYAPPGALGMDLHTVALIVTPDNPGLPPRIRVEPPNDRVRLAVEARSGTAGSFTVTRLGDGAYRVNGNMRSDAGPSKWRFSLQNPARYAAEALRTILAEQRIQTGGEVEEGQTPAGAKLLVRVEAPPLANLIRETNVHSLNVVADTLLLSLGADRYGAPGTRQKGLRVVTEFLAGLGLAADGTTIADGSGLRNDNRVTPLFLVEYLRRITGKAWYGSFRESLPRSGLDGTVRDVGYTNERFRVKSGRLEDAFALAGYGVDGTGREIAFAFIVNTAPGGVAMNLERSGAEVMSYLATEVLK